MTTRKRFHWRDYFTLKKINPVISALTVSDMFVLGGFGLMSPIFAVFITDNIEGGSIEVVGFSQMIYLLTSSLLQVPVAAIVDKVKGERDDFNLMFAGTAMSSIIILLYIFVKTPEQLYFVQFLYGLAMAIALPTWYAIFTRHLDKRHEGLEWGIYNTMTALFGAGAAALGGLIAFRFGFTTLFVMVSAISFSGSLLLLAVRKEMRKTT